MAEEEELELSKRKAEMFDLNKHNSHYEKDPVKERKKVEELILSDFQGRRDMFKMDLDQESDRQPLQIFNPKVLVNPQ